MDGDTLMQRRSSSTQLGVASIGFAPRASLTLLAMVFAQGACAGDEWLRIEKPADIAPVYDSCFGASVAMANRELWVGDPCETINEEWQAGAVYVFARAGTGWRLRTRIATPSPVREGRFGHSVAGNGKFQGGIGAPGEGSGKVYVATVDSSGGVSLEWRGPHNQTSGSGFGKSLAASSAGFVAARPNTDCSSYLTCGGDATLLDPRLSYAFSISWSNPDHIRTSQFGESASADALEVLIGAPGTGNGQTRGAAYLFALSEPTPSYHATATAYFAPTSMDPYLLFGTTTALRGNWIAIGAPCGGGYACPAGAWLYHRSASGTWAMHDVLTDDAPHPIGQFGRTVAWNGLDLLVGTRSNDDTSGAVATYTLAASGWTVSAKHLPEVGDTEANLGSSLAGGDTVWAAGAPGSHSLTTPERQVGAVYVFDADDLFLDDFEAH